MSQNWEYKFIKGKREPKYQNGEFGSKIISGFEENWIWTDDNQKIITPFDIYKLAKELGAQGWELISIVPSSTVVSAMTSGATTELLWVFKRPEL
jgi:hypothetical protein